MIGVEDYLHRWSLLHGNYEPRSSWLVHGWLRCTYWLAWPLARLGVPPDAVTFAGLAATGIAVWIASIGGHWPVVAALLIGVAGIIDNIDGAVAVVTGRTSTWGAVLDSVVDRCGDALLLCALWLLGAPAGVVVAAGFVSFLQEYARARAAAVGALGIEVVTVDERPVRVAVVAMFVLGVGIYQSAAWAIAAAWLSLGLAFVGFAQLSIALRRRLSRTSDEVSDDHR